MEEEPLLGPRFAALITTVLVAFSLASCALPRIAVLHDPLTPEEHVNLGVSYEKRGELEPALREYRAGAKKIPLAYLYMGNVYFQQERVKDAAAAYKKAIHRTDSPEAYNNLAWLYYTQNGDMEEAQRLAQRAVDLMPASSTFRDTLEKIRERKGDRPIPRGPE